MVAVTRPNAFKTVTPLLSIPLMLRAAPDQADGTRTVIVAAYRRTLEALQRADADAALQMNTNDRVSITVGQRDIASMKPSPGWSAIWKPDYERNGTASGIQVYDLKLDGDSAAALCLVGNSRVEMVDGTARTVWIGSHVRDTWIRTSTGWKRRKYEKLTANERLVDGPR